MGRFLSLVLRHQPSAVGIKLDAQSWAEVGALLQGCNRAGKKIDRGTLERIVKENGKQRYNFNEDRTRIRTNRGHSLEVDVELREAAPPDVLYHGTASHSLEVHSCRRNREGDAAARALVQGQGDGALSGQTPRQAGSAAVMMRDGRAFTSQKVGFGSAIMFRWNTWGWRTLKNTICK